ncbi:endonuclease/exonuclease/phosphatase family protein [Plastorhodobacter daqingensis]|uniref:Endonuclease/exonuclease/phosphatase family protein n=1 Tax=Plastorhodobacter daqingensis TaxID=1387281 RepID=A0ABW2UMW8_9RHOB
MRIVTYNVEWFNSLFDDDGRLIDDAALSGRRDVTRHQQIAALGVVFAALDGDAVLVVEAPDQSRRRSCVRALEGFAHRFGLRANRALIGFASDSQQEIALLYDPAALSVIHDPQGEPTGKRGSENAPRFDGVFRIDLDLDGTPELVTFARPPLELLIETISGKILRMIGVHVKSKAPHGARGPDEGLRLSIENRRKQYAQCLWLRQRIDDHIAAGDPLIVLGDFNDGPGLEEFEHLFSRSAVDIVLGWDRAPKARLYDHHARLALANRTAAAPVSARFLMPDEQHYFSALLDYIMISEDLRQHQPVWRIWYPFDDAGCYGDPLLREALLLASDHFPVSLDLVI